MSWKKYFHGIDLQGAFELLRAKLGSSADLANEGEIGYDATAKRAKIHDGAAPRKILQENDLIDVSGKYEETANKGQASGYASLGSDGLVPSSQLPAAQLFVPAVATFAVLPSASANSGELYFVVDATDNTPDGTEKQLYRSNGTTWDAVSGAVDISLSYNDLTDVPNEFTPVDHLHVIADVTGLQTALNNKPDFPGAPFVADGQGSFRLPNISEVESVAGGLTLSSADGVQIYAQESANGEGLLSAVPGEVTFYAASNDLSDFTFILADTEKITLFSFVSSLALRSVIEVFHDGIKITSNNQEGLVNQVLSVSDQGGDKRMLYEDQSIATNKAPGTYTPVAGGPTYLVQEVNGQNRITRIDLP